MRHFTRRLPIAAVLVLGLLVVACDPTNPTPSQLVPADWGANLRPAVVDQPYLPSAVRGCGAGAASHERCGGSQTADIYRPTAGGNKGTVVFVHGGGFSAGDKRDLTSGYFGPILRQTARGWSVVSVNYRLSADTRNLFPTGVADVAAALSWVRKGGAGVGVNTDRVVVVGHSAGGTLAALAGTAANSGRPEFAALPRLSGWASIAGIMDFEAGNYSRLWGMGWLGVNYAALRSVASPVTWWDPSDPAGYVVHGDLDGIVEFANVARLQARTAGSARVTYDVVDVYNDGQPLPAGWREHIPTYGMHGPNFDAWLDTAPSVATERDPFGGVDAVKLAGPGRVSMNGWVIDPDTTGPVAVHIYVNGRYRQAATANTLRADVGRAHPGFGDNHGFTAQLTGLGGGPNEICVFAINVGRGTGNPAVGCRTVNIPAGNPFGSLDVVRAEGSGMVRVAGWALDPDVVDPVRLHIYVNGRYRQAATANTLRADVGRAHPGFGDNHGFTAQLTGLGGGPNEICVFAINVGRGTGNPELGCRTVTVS